MYGWQCIVRKACFFYGFQHGCQKCLRIAYALLADGCTDAADTVLERSYGTVRGDGKHFSGFGSSKVDDV